ncbi:unnamed protein product [Durusdinium trenchii]|uniref:Aminopeptidase n=1 Tax=Durusdinium trenchii TaxID=1381693 RepID=A0ABP0J1N1_9DINO
MAKAEGRVLLPPTVEPVKYDIKLKPDLVNFTFDGSEKIRLDIQEATDEIALHVKEIAIKNHTIVLKAGSTEVKPEAVTYSIKDATVTFKFEEMLPVGEAELELEFFGLLNDQMAGFYRSGYKDITGASKIMASTQFESLDARRAFPCWDEPGRKAVFGLTLVVDTGLTALSNMPEKHRCYLDGGAKMEVAFMDSPKMSTYLLAFIVGEFDFIQAQTSHGVLVRVFAPPGRSKDGQFPLEVAVKALDGYDDYFGLPYPLPKLDMIAIPEFAAGAMENWGLVTYREVDLLIAEGASRKQMQRVCIVVTHELAHQWFGNLVTMNWWDDLWLNEGFASWCENYMAHEIFPDFAMWDQFTSDTQAAAMRLDSLRSSHPIQVPIKHAEEVEEVFDAISYCKGASVIKMAHAYLGADAFRSGLQAYMQKHKYSNTETSDLWAAWSTASGCKVNELMASWTEQMGYPLVTVKSFNGSEVELEQSWFLADGSEVKKEEEKIWKIPIICKGQKPVLMEAKTQKISVPKSDFLLINAGRQVPMRVLYSDETYSQLATAIQKGQLSVSDKAGLVLDSFALAKSGHLGADKVFKLIASFRSERNFIVWDAISQALTGFDTVLMAGVSDPTYAAFKAFVSKLIADAAKEVGWEKKASDGHLDGLLRETLINMQSKYSVDPEAMAEAKRRFDAFMAGDASLLPDDIKEPVFKMALKSGGKKEYQALRNLQAKATTNIERKHVYVTIGHTADIALKKDVLDWVVSGDIKIQDFFYPMGSVAASSKEAAALTWDYYKSHFDRIWSMCKTASPSLMDAMISLSARGFSTAEAAAEVEQFYKEHPLKQNQRTISQLLEGIRNLRCKASENRDWGVLAPAGYGSSGNQLVKDSRVSSVSKKLRTPLARQGESWTNAAFLNRILKTPVIEESFWKSL